MDFLLLDSNLDIREKEFRRFMRWLSAGAIVVFHDANHSAVHDGIRRLIADGIGLAALFVPTPRGLFLARYLGDNEQGVSNADQNSPGLIQRVKELEIQLSLMRQSISWRITFPLRKIRSGMRWVRQKFL